MKTMSLAFFPEYNGTWVEEPMDAKIPIVSALDSRVSELKRHELTSVCVAANWLARRVTPLKK
jgi:hypothetical protein